MKETPSPGRFPLEGGRAVADTLREEAAKLGAECVGDLEVVAREGSFHLRIAAIESLMALDPEAGEACAIAALADGTSSFVPDVDEGIENVDEDESDGKVRAAAAVALGNAVSPLSLQALIHAVADPSPLVARGATDGLASRRELGSSEAIVEAIEARRAEPMLWGVPRLVAALVAHTDAHARSYLAELAATSPQLFDDDAVRRLGNSIDYPEIRPIVVPLFRRETPNIRGRVPAPAEIPALSRELAPNPDDPHETRRAADVLMKEAPEIVFETAAGFCEAQELDDDFGKHRAIYILSGLAERLRVCARGESRVLPDARWRAVCERLLASNAPYHLCESAESVLDGLAWFEGTYVPRAVTSVLLGEFGTEPFPFFVAGFSVEKTLEAKAAVARAARGAPPGLASFDARVGGHACELETWVGYAFHGNAPFESSESLRQLRKAWRATRGEEMNERELLDFNAGLRAMMRIPPLERGREAIVVSVPCSPLKAFRNEPILGFRKYGAQWEYVDFYATDPAPEVTISSAYDETHEDALLRMGELLDLGRPRVALLWGNSD